MHETAKGSFAVALVCLLASGWFLYQKSGRQIRWESPVFTSGKAVFQFDTRYEDRVSAVVHAPIAPEMLSGIHWELKENDKVIGVGTSENGTLAQFSVTPNNHYVWTLTTSKDLSPLAESDAYILIAPELSELEHITIYVIISLLAGIGMAARGIFYQRRAQGP
jgi:hypothetical protein